MKYKYIILCAIALMSITSCDEDFLDVEYKNGYIGENFMQSESQAKEAVTAIYDVLNWTGFYNFASYVLGEAPTDNIENDWGDGGYGPFIVEVNSLNWNGENRYFGERWNHAYVGITRANYVINKIDKIDRISDTKRNQFMGEALFLRAFFYYNMVTGFGEVPLVLKVLSAEEANKVEKTSEDLIWDQIIMDLKEAYKLLPASYDEETDLGHATSGAAAGLLSRVYLWGGNYQDAIDAANDVVGYNLVDNDAYCGMFDGTNEFSKESIFEVVRIQGFGNIWSGTASETSQLIHMAPRNPWGDYFHPRKKGGYDVADYFEVGDYRRIASMYIPYVDNCLYEGESGVFPDTDIYSDWRPNIVNNEVYQMRKFLPKDASDWAKGGTYFKKYDANHPVLRYAEVMLNKAEAHIELNQLSEAVILLKELRERSGLTEMIDGNIPSLTTISGVVDIDDLDQAQLRELVRQERRVELFFEGHRWFDLKRWGILEEVLTNAGITGFDASKNTNWPIPTSEREINPNLAK